MSLYAIMIGVMGFNPKYILIFSGTISTEYITGVKYIHAIEIIPRICSKSRKYTVNADVNIAIPKHNIYSTIIIIGKYNRAIILKPTPTINNTANITIKQNNIFTKAVVIKAIGSTCRGKYTFFTKFSSLTIDVDPPVNDALKKSHGINATNRNK